MHENVFVEWVKLDMLSMARKVRWNLGGSLLGGWVRLVGIAGLPVLQSGLEVGLGVDVIES